MGVGVELKSKGGGKVKLKSLMKLMKHKENKSQG